MAMTVATKDYLVLLETKDDIGKDYQVPRKWKQSSIDYLQTLGHDIPYKMGFVYRATSLKRYILFGKGVPLNDTDECCDDNTEFLLLKMKNGVLSQVTKKKTLLRYRVHLMDREVRTKNSKPRVLHCDTCDHPRRYSNGPCAEGCLCCKPATRPEPPTAPVPKQADPE